MQVPPRPHHIEDVWFVADVRFALEQRQARLNRNTTTFALAGVAVVAVICAVLLAALGG
jgi:hypothetical protein